MLLVASLGSQALSHAHSHDVTSEVNNTVHSASHHDEDCNPVIDCDEPHDTNTSNFHFESSHYVLVQLDLLSIDTSFSTGAIIDRDETRHDDLSLSTPFPPPKHS